MIFSLPMPPSINKAYITVGKYRRLSPIARAWYKEVAIIIKKQIKTNIFYESLGYENCYPINKDEKVKVMAEFYFKYPKKCDTSNYTKLLWDSLQKNNIIKNDNLMFKEEILKYEAGDLNPTVSVLLQNYSPTKVGRLNETNNRIVRWLMKDSS